MFKKYIYIFLTTKKTLFNTHKKDLCTVTHLKRIKTKFVLIIIICTNNNNNNNNDDEALYVVPISVSVLTYHFSHCEQHMYTKPGLRAGIDQSQVRR